MLIISHNALVPMVEGTTRRRAVKLIGGSMVVMAGCSGAQEQTTDEITINLASGYPDEDMYPTMWNDFEKRLEEKSDGAITVKVFGNAQQGSDREIAQKVQTGSLQMGQITVNNLGPFIPELSVKNLPGLIPSIQKGNQLLNSQTWKDFAWPKARNSSFEPLFSWMFDFRHAGVNPGVVEEGIKTPEDMEGLKVRVASQTERISFEAIGADPIQVAWPEAPSAMKEGVFDVIHSSRLSHCSVGFSGFEAHVSNPNIAATAMTYFMNKPWFNGLDQTHKDIIKEAAAEQRKEAIKTQQEAVKSAEQCIKDNGANFIDLSNSTRQKWYDIVGWQEDIWNDYQKEFDITDEVAQKLYDETN